MTTNPATWDLAGRSLPDFPVGPARVVVVSAHPDDETLAVAGVMTAFAESGAELALVVATDGEAAFPDWDDGRRRQLAARRRQEMEDALAALGLAHIAVYWLGFPDSALAADPLAEALRPVLAGADVCLAPWPNDPHPDHRAAGVAARAASAAGTTVWSFPLWTWVWQEPGAANLPWEVAARFRLGPDQRAAKKAALDCFASQLRPGPGGEPPIVDAAARAHFEQGVEVLFRLPGPASTPIDRFDDLYRTGADPWATATSPYERRKRALTLACLPRPSYRRALDAGCGTGSLTVELARICDRITAVDGVERAVRTARVAMVDLPHVSVQQARLPAGFPPGPFDLLVFSEILYYLSVEDLSAVMDAAECAAGPGADLVAVDWRPVTPDAPRDADSAHRQLLGRPGWEVLVEHSEAEFLLHVLRRR